MTDHAAVPILPCNDIDKTQAFYERLGIAVTGGDSDGVLVRVGRPA